MAKADTPRRKTRQSKVVTDKVGEIEPNTEEQTKTVCSSKPSVFTEEDASAESTETKQEEKIQDEQDSQVDCVIEVKGSTPTVAVSWEKTSGGEGDDSEKGSDLSDQPTDQKMMESEIDTKENENTTTVTEPGTEKPEGQSVSIQQETNGKEKAGKTRKRKRKAKEATKQVEASPSKKTKLINDGFCLYVGNLNNTKTFEEVKDSLASHLMTQGLLFQDIRLDRSKKHAHVDLASVMDLKKALTLNGDMILDKPVNIAKAKVKLADKVQNKKAANDARCLFVKNLPFTAKKAQIQKLFPRAIGIRFPGGAEESNQGIAFVEFKNQDIAKKIQKKMQGTKINKRVLIVDFVREANVTKVIKAPDAISKTPAAAPPNNTLFVSNMSRNLKEKNLKKLFQKAVGIKIPQSEGKSKGFAFVKFATVAEAETALESTQNLKVGKKTIRVEFMKVNTEEKTVDLKTLIVQNLSEKTTPETLQSVFEGALAARVTVKNGAGVSKRFGFVQFESEEMCKTVKEAMQDCEIDGNKVTVAYAKQKAEKREQGPKGGSAVRPGAAGRASDGSGSRGGRRRGARAPQDTVEKVKNKE